jgi:23S rRNA (uracil1939-C5)-methyltransferase
MPIPAKQSRPQTPISIQIEDIAFGGAGVGRAGGKALFVPYTIDGEQVIVEITERKKKFDRGRLVEISEASPQRVSPPCPYFAKCGGCDYQHIRYEYQTIVKHRQIVQVLQRIGRLPDIKVLPTIASPNSYGFRNRITVHSDGDRIGFFGKQNRNVLDIEICAIASPRVNERLRQLRAKGMAEGEHRTLREHEGIRTFSQTNDRVASLLFDYVAEHANGSVLIDAYCGSGFFGHRLADRFQKVVGIDWSERAIAGARRDAAENETYLIGDVGALLDETLTKHRPDCVILDPSAEGADERVTTALNQFPPLSVVYVSCNPSTLARDLARLTDHYEIKTIQPFDMFPQTAEIEAVALLNRK